jgi:hypothetical protein
LASSCTINGTEIDESAMTGHSNETIVGCFNNFLSDSLVVGSGNRSAVAGSYSRIDRSVIRGNANNWEVGIALSNGGGCVDVTNSLLAGAKAFDQAEFSFDPCTNNAIVNSTLYGATRIVNTRLVNNVLLTASAPVLLSIGEPFFLCPQGACPPIVLPLRGRTIANNALMLTGAGAAVNSAYRTATMLAPIGINETAINDANEWFGSGGGSVNLLQGMLAFNHFNEIDPADLNPVGPPWKVLHPTMGSPIGTSGAVVTRAELGLGGLLGELAVDLDGNPRNHSMGSESIGAYIGR